jgi:hypothetical protein
VTFANTGGAPLDHVWLRVWANGPGGCDQPAAQITVTAGGVHSETTAGCTAYRVDLTAPLAPGAQATLALALRVVAPRANDRFGHSGGAVLFGNAIPVLAVEDADGPRLVSYSTVGESFYSLAAAWRVQLDVPAGAEAALTGTETSARVPLADGGSRLVSETAAARDVAIAVGPYAVTEARVGSVAVRVLRLRSAEPATAGRLRRWAVNAVRRYSGWFGALGATPGAATGLDVVQTRFSEFGGMEYPELVFVVDDSASVAHEIAHQWFYGLVGTDQWREPWLDEGFATFAQRRLAGTLADCPVRQPLADWPGTRLTSSMALFEREPERYGAVYDGGACALEAVRRGWGPARFNRLIRTWVRTHRLGIGTTAEFVALVRRQAPRGYDVDAWLRRSRIDVPA